MAHNSRSPRHVIRRGGRRSIPTGEAIQSEKDYKLKIPGVGFGHKIHRASEISIDDLLLAHLEVPDGENGPYRYESPRHITSIPRITLDGAAARMLGLGTSLRSYQQDWSELCAEVEFQAKRPLSCELGEAFKASGTRVAVEIDCPYISRGIGSIKRLLQNAGVGVPEMHPPHLTIGKADSFRDQLDILKATREVLSGACITFDPLEIYLDSYTTTIRPQRAITD